MVRRAPSYGGQAERLCQINETIISYWYRISRVTYKSFRCCGIAGWLFGLTLGKAEECSILGARGLKPCGSTALV